MEFYNYVLLHFIYPAPFEMFPEETLGLGFCFFSVCYFSYVKAF